MKTLRWIPLLALAAIPLAHCGTVEPISPSPDASIAADAATADVSRPTPDASDPDAGPQKPGPATSSKVDVLFVVDNSRSMVEKQALLAASAGRFIERLVTPKCLDETFAVVGDSVDGVCKTGKIEHSPVKDMHVGVLTSSLGGLASDSCPADALPGGNDDKGRLVNRPNLSTAPGGYLAFAPGSAAPAIGDSATLVRDTLSLVGGVGDKGCGFEGPLEAMHRFLIAPDPAGAARSGNMANRASIDGTVLAQRKAFLREDSVVAIVVLTDEDDSTVDPYSVGGQGWAFMNATFPSSAGVAGAQRPAGRGGSTAPRGTAACLSNPASPNCTSCGFKADPRVQNDTSCAANEGFYGPNEDDLNVRFHEMKRRYGVDPQYPIKRYVDGLSALMVSRGSKEHDANGNYLDATECRNPLYAKGLPADASGELCQLAAGPRSPFDVFFTVLAGMPSTLGSKADAKGAPTPLAAGDWEKLVGRNPDTYDATGIDPHMLQSTSPRAGLPGPGASNTADPVHGREWSTGGVELQSACTFAFATPVPCTTANRETCECGTGTTAPFCSSSDPTIQERGRAVPGIRHLRVAKGLGEQAIVGSICPIQTSDPSRNDFGYAPTLAQLGTRIGQRLK